MGGKDGGMEGGLETAREVEGKEGGGRRGGREKALLIRVCIYFHPAGANFLRNKHQSIQNKS